MHIEKHTVGLLMLPEAQLLDLAGPCDVFNTANQLLELTHGNTNKYYNIILISFTDSKIITTSSGVKIQCDYTFKDIDLKIDTLLITGSSLDLNSDYEPALLHWIKGIYPSLIRIGSICIGLFLLAKTGLINNKRVTTHWKYANLFSQKYPNTNLQYDHIYLKDGNIYTSGGITSGIDLALALTEEDLGREMAANISRHLVVNLKRSHSQIIYASLLAEDLEMSPLVKKTKIIS
ncbi:GlxA family transcriptional regulator [Myroides injenensis]|uniref:GlxA family transcriptional regulator n=1 Tax=Myroides injenensis TaxID=1183151 RepID=UPI0002894C11|nr:AraC family transcriptional regulator [Myroides injenensis]